MMLKAWSTLSINHPRLETETPLINCPLVGQDQYLSHLLQCLVQVLQEDFLQNSDI